MQRICESVVCILIKISPHQQWNLTLQVKCDPGISLPITGFPKLLSRLLSDAQYIDPVIKSWWAKHQGKGYHQEEWPV